MGTPVLGSSPARTDSIRATGPIGGGGAQNSLINPLQNAAGHATDGGLRRVPQQPSEALDVQDPVNQPHEISGGQRRSGRRGADPSEPEEDEAQQMPEEWAGPRLESGQVTNEQTM
jgi:hypothetical protein